MVINNEYFKGDIYLPQAKPSLAAESSLSQTVQAYIDEYSADCFLKLLGPILLDNFADKLDPSRENGLKDGVDQKWDDLLNGKIYTNSKGKSVRWRGIRYKSPGSDQYKSLAADYTYFFFQTQKQTTSSLVGEKKVQAKNSQNADVSTKTTNAWNRFVKIAQPVKVAPTIIYGAFGYGVDYFNKELNQYGTLRTFIEDMNKQNENTYPDYTPETFQLINSLGI